MDNLKTLTRTNNSTSSPKALRFPFRSGSVYLLLAAISLLYSCKDSGTDPNAETDVAAAVETLNNALVDPNGELLKTLVMPQLTYGHSSGVIQNKEEFIDQLLHGTFDFLSVSTSDQTIDVSGNTAIVRHILSIQGTEGGPPASSKIGIMLVFQKKGGNWLLLARQAYKL